MGPALKEGVDLLPQDLFEFTLNSDEFFMEFLKDIASPGKSLKRGGALLRIPFHGNAITGLDGIHRQPK